MEVNLCHKLIGDKRCPCSTFVPSPLNPQFCTECEHISTHAFQQVRDVHNDLIAECSEKKVNHILGGLKIKELKDHQRQAITKSIEGNDVLVIAPTGSGKSLCYELPALYFKGLMTIVVLPMRTLVLDKVAIAEKRGIPCEKIWGDMSDEEKLIATDKVSNRKVKFIFVTPEMLVQQWVSDLFHGLIQNQHVARIAVDEADFTSIQGDYRNKAAEAMSKFFPTCINVPKIAVTANANSAVQLHITNILHLHEPEVVLNNNLFRENFTYNVEFVQGTVANIVDQKVIRLITKKHIGLKGCIFCQTVDQCGDIAKQLEENSIRAVNIHRESENKKEKMEVFQNGTVDVLVATSAIQRGVDFTNVTYAIHIGLPKSLTIYHQQTGRCGRNNKPAFSYTFWNLMHRDTNVRLIEQEQKGQHQRNTEMMDLRKCLTFFLDETTCRHVLLARNLHLNATECEDRCSNCLASAEEQDVSTVVKDIFSILKKYPPNIAVTFVIELLMGTKTDRSRASGGKLDEFSKAKEYARTDLQKIMCKLVGLGFLSEMFTVINKYSVKWSVSLTPKADTFAGPFLHRCDEKPKRKRSTNSSSKQNKGKDATPEKSSRNVGHKNPGKRGRDENKEKRSGEKRNRPSNKPNKRTHQRKDDNNTSDTEQETESDTEAMEESETELQDSRKDKHKKRAKQPHNESEGETDKERDNSKRRRVPQKEHATKSDKNAKGSINKRNKNVTNRNTNTTKNKIDSNGKGDNTPIDIEDSQSSEEMRSDEDSRIDRALRSDGDEDIRSDKDSRIDKALRSDDDLASDGDENSRVVRKDEEQISEDLRSDEDSRIVEDLRIEKKRTDEDLRNYADLRNSEAFRKDEELGSEGDEEDLRKEEDQKINEALGNEDDEDTEMTAAQDISMEESNENETKDAPIVFNDSDTDFL